MSEPAILELPVLGMTCAACVRRVEKAVAAVPGVTRADVNLPLSRAHVELAEGADRDGVIRAIRGAGYEVPADALDAPTGSARLAAIDRAAGEDTRALRRDAVIAIALTVPLVVLAMAELAPIAQAVLGTIVVLGPGLRYFRGGARAVRHGAPDMNTLIALGAGAAWLASVVALARGTGAIYFEAAGAIVAFVMIGKLLEARARARLTDAVRGLLSLAPALAHTDDGRDVDAAALVPGDAIVVRPGERVPADGTVIGGTSSVDEATLTGEALPVDKTEGAPLYAGTLNHHGALTVRVARAGADTALARIARAVEDAQGSKAPIARLADRVSAWFVPVVLLLALATGAAWLVAGAGTDLAIARAVAVLVVACPCALGLATPAAVAVGTARGAELGVLFHRAAALEIASHIDVVCLDKTGTLTAGAPAVVRVLGRTLTADALLAAAASAEQASEHPLARAIVAAARDKRLPLGAATDVVAAAGAGVSARVDGAPIVVGSREMLLLAGIDAPEEAAEMPAGASLCYVAIDGAYAGVVAVADPPAPDAAAAIAALKQLGVRTVMITGDRVEVARELGRAVGIATIHAAARPTEKAAIVRAQAGRVAMVGDGVNDAPALAAADLGIAIGTGADIAAAAADVTLMRGGVSAVATALALARATMRVIRTNLVAAFAYNAACIPLAAAGYLSPMLAAAAMSVSSVSVLLSSLRLRRWRRAEQ